MDKEHAMFVKRLTELMEEINISEIDLAKKVDTTNVTISRYLSGKRKPRIEIASKIANVFSVSTDYLLGRSNIRNSEQQIDKDFMAFYNGYSELKIEDRKRLDDYFQLLVEKNKNKKKGE